MMLFGTCTLPRPIHLLVAILVALVLVPRPTATLGIKLAASLPVTATDPTDSHVAVAIKQYLELSLADVNAQVANPAGHNVTLQIYDSAAKRGNATANVHKAAAIGALGMIGDKGSGNTIPLALNAKAFGMHVCSGSSTSTKLSQAQFRNTYLRTLAADDAQGQAFAHYLIHMNWKAVCVIASTSNYGRSVAASFAKATARLNINIVTTQLVNVQEQSVTRHANLRRAVTTVAETGIRIILFFGVEEEFLAIAEYGIQAGIVDDNHLWLASEGVSDFKTQAKKNTTIHRLTNGMQWLFPTEIVDKDRAQRLVDRSLPVLNRSDFEGYGGFYIDCMYALTHMYVNMLKNGVSEADLTARRVQKPIPELFVPFTGITGRVELDEAGNRKSSFSVFNLHEDKTTECFTITLQGAVTQLAAPKSYTGTALRLRDRPDDVIGYLRFTDIAAWIVLSVTGLIGLAVVVSTAMILRQHQHPVVNAYHPIALVMTSVGLLVYLVASISWFDEQSVLTCQVGLWGTSVGLEVVVVALLLRTYNSWYSSENPILRKSAAHSTSLFQIMVIIALLMIEMAILGLWTILAPVKPQPLATITSFSYQCVSDDLALFNVFKWMHVVWLGLLLSGLLYLTSITRYLRTPGHSSRYAHFVAVNYFFCGAIIAVFTSLPLPSFALGSFYTELALMWYSSGFTLAMTHFRILRQIGKPDDRPHYDPSSRQDSDVTASLSRPMMVPAGMAVPLSPTGSSFPSTTPRRVRTLKGLTPIAGKKSSYLCDLAIRFPSPLSIWQQHRMMIALDEGYFGVTRLSHMEVATGQAWAMSSVFALPSRELDLVVEMIRNGQPLLYVQTVDAEQKKMILELFRCRQY